jgi:uncharacterized membrane protein HdeD (DUF308 family)
MSEPNPEGLRAAVEEGRTAVASVARWWWLLLITGVAWFVVAFVILQFSTSSVVTLGYIVGFMLLFTGIEQFLLASAASGWKWVWYAFGVFFVAGGLWAILNPGETVATLAISLGLLFGLIGVFWVIEAFVTKSANPLWWLGLVSGILLLGIAFWVGQQGFAEKAITLLTFAGIWAIMQGVTDLIRAFQLRRLGSLVSG